MSPAQRLLAHRLVGNLRRAISQCGAVGGQVLDFDGAAQRGLITRPQRCDRSTKSAATSGAGAQFNQPGNSWCAIEFNNQLTRHPGTERIGFLGRGV